MKRVLLAGFLLSIVLAVEAAGGIYAEGIIESGSGFKFPDGTIVTSPGQVDYSQLIQRIEALENKVHGLVGTYQALYWSTEIGAEGSYGEIGLLSHNEVGELEFFEDGTWSYLDLGDVIRHVPLDGNFVVTEEQFPGETVGGTYEETGNVITLTVGTEAFQLFATPDRGMLIGVSNSGDSTGAELFVNVYMRK